MAIRRRCRGTCRSARRCLEHLWFDVKHRNTRYRMPVNDFAVPRMEPSKQRPVQSMEEVRDWERLFVGEIKAGRDPRIRPAARRRRRISRGSPASSTRISNVTCDRLGFAASTRRRTNQGPETTLLRRPAVKALEEPAIVNRFKTESEYSAGSRSPRCTKCWRSCVPPSAGARRRRRRSSTSRRSTASAFG